MMPSCDERWPVASLGALFRPSRWQPGVATNRRSPAQSRDRERSKARLSESGRCNQFANAQVFVVGNFVLVR